MDRSILRLFHAWQFNADNLLQFLVIFAEIASKQTNSELKAWASEQKVLW